MCFLVFAVAFMVYANTLNNDFIWDDEYLILNNSQIKSFSHIHNVFKTYVGYGSENINNFYRPMQEISNMTTEHILPPASLEFFEKYLNNASPTGYELEGQKIWMAYLKPYVDTFITDTYGTAVGVIYFKRATRSVLPQSGLHRSPNGAGFIKYQLRRFAKLAPVKVHMRVSAINGMRSTFSRWQPIKGVNWIEKLGLITRRCYLDIQRQRYRFIEC